MDLLLSSGFLAFGRQAGFLQGVEDAGLEVDAVVGTSSGALAGALWCAGFRAREVLAELASAPPLLRLAPAWPPWRGLLSMGPVLRRMERLLPPTFADLPRPFAVGVMTPDGRHRLVHDGPLAPAVAASAAIPRLFRPVPVEGVPCADGAFVDRVGAAAWCRWRPGRQGLVHLVERTGGVPVEGLPDDLLVVRTPRSGARLWRLGDVEARFEEARVLTTRVLDGAGMGRAAPRGAAP